MGSTSVVASQSQLLWAPITHELFFCWQNGMRTGDIWGMPLNFSISGVVPYTIICLRMVLWRSSDGGIWQEVEGRPAISLERVPFVSLELTPGTEGCNPVAPVTSLPFTARWVPTTGNVGVKNLLYRSNCLNREKKIDTSQIVNKNTWIIEF